jgi:rhomboid protease GluP
VNEGEDRNQDHEELDVGGRLFEDQAEERESQPPETDSTQPPPIRIQPRQVVVKLPPRKPVVTYSILVLTVGIYLLQMGSQYLFEGVDWPAFWGMKINELISAGQLWRLFTPVLLHGSILHIGFNMYALHIMGPPLERYYGHWQFMLLYVIGGFAGIATSFALTKEPSLGASTAIFGLLAAQGVFAYQNQKIFGQGARRALRHILNIALINFIIGLSPGIDNWGHMGGLVGGVLVAWFGGPVFKLEGIGPELQLRNKREGRTLFVAALNASLLFGFLTAGMIYIRGG